MSLKSSTRNQNSAKTQANMVFFDPGLIKAARNIYRSYCNLNVPTEHQPRGIVINRDSHRGQLAFNPKPVLLPRECFIPLQQIEAERY
ncbi:MAG: hypothetical protein AAFV28_04980 [Cyanobacteria bacterium J06635_13]